MRMVFEVDNLDYATPATVSRAGILYVNETDIGYMALVDSWLHKRTHPGELAAFPKLFERYLPSLMKSFETLETIIKPPPVALVTSLLVLLSSFLDETPSTSRDADRLEKVLLSQAAFVFGSPCVSKEAFSLEFKNIVGKSWNWAGSNCLDYFVSPIVAAL